MVSRAGGAIRFVPYPVIGGFLGATGWLMVSGAARVITDHGLTTADIDNLLSPSSLAKLAAGAAIAFALYLSARRRSNSPYVLPIILLTGIAAAHLVFALAATSLAEAHAEGGTFKAPTAVGLTPTWDFGDLALFPCKVLPSLSGDLLAVVFVTARCLMSPHRVRDKAGGRPSARVDHARRR